MLIRNTAIVEHTHTHQHGAARTLSRTHTQPRAHYCWVTTTAGRRQNSGRRGNGELRGDDDDDDSLTTAESKWCFASVCYATRTTHKHTYVIYGWALGL